MNLISNRTLGFALLAFVSTQAIAFQVAGTHPNGSFTTYDIMCDSGAMESVNVTSDGDATTMVAGRTQVFRGLNQAARAACGE
jgi:hypothetical protein